MPPITRSAKRSAVRIDDKAIVKRSANPEKKVLGFLDLGTDCLLEICDRLRVKPLCLLGYTCRTMLAIVRKSFTLKQITKAVLSSVDYRLKRKQPIWVKSISRMAIILVVLDGILEKVSINTSERGDYRLVFESLSRIRSGKLTCLEIFDTEGI